MKKLHLTEAEMELLIESMINDYDSPETDLGLKLLRNSKYNITETQSILAEDLCYLAGELGFYYYTEKNEFIIEVENDEEEGSTSDMCVDFTSTKELKKAIKIFKKMKCENKLRSA